MGIIIYFYNVLLKDAFFKITFFALGKNGEIKIL
jgi:hypothetical protein